MHRARRPTCWGGRRPCGQWEHLRLSREEGSSHRDDTPSPASQAGPAAHRQAAPQGPVPPAPAPPSGLTCYPLLLLQTTPAPCLVSRAPPPRQACCGGGAQARSLGGFPGDWAGGRGERSINNSRRPVCAGSTREKVRDGRQQLPSPLVDVQENRPSPLRRGRFPLRGPQVLCN